MMNNTIDLSKPVAQLVEEHPELKELLVDLGFKPLANPLMLETVGRTTSLQAGAKIARIPLEKIIRTLEFNGYQVEGEQQ